MSQSLVSFHPTTHLRYCKSYVHSVKINPCLPQEKLPSNIKEHSSIKTPHFSSSLPRGNLVLNPPSPNLTPLEVFLTAKKAPRKNWGVLGRSIPSPFLESDPPDHWTQGLLGGIETLLIGRWQRLFGQVGGWVTHRCWGGSTITLSYLSPQWINGTWST